MFGHLSALRGLSGENGTKKCYDPNCVMLDNTLEISAALNALAREGCIPTIDELAALSPYLTRHIKRFGNYELDLAAIAAPATDDPTFELEPPQESSTIEAEQNTPPASKDE